VHVRLSDETRGLVTEANRDRMSPSAPLVNTSRSELIAPGALQRALRRGRPDFAARRPVNLLHPQVLLSLT
jgi:D-3-phosphoglycerate dehydrogenase